MCVWSHVHAQRILLVYKTTNSQIEAYANAVICKRIEAKRAVNWAHTTDGRKIVLPHSRWHKWTTLPNYDYPQITSAADIRSFQAKYSELRGFASKYHKTKPFLNELLLKMKVMDANLSAGMVAHKGEWISRSSYLKIVAEAKRAREADLRAREQKRRMLVKEEAEKLRREEDSRRKQREQLEAAKKKQRELEKRRLIQTVSAEIKELESKLETIQAKKSRIKKTISQIISNE